jgi:Beta-lactamase enzyme family
MMKSRAGFLASVAAGAAAVPFAGRPVRAAGNASGDVSAKIGELLDSLPGVTGACIYSADKTFSYERNPDRALLVGSCFKAFVAVVIHRMIEEGRCSFDELLPLNESVYMPGSPAFTPKLRGQATVRVALQEMIAYSDNTATDMLMKRANVANIRKFIASAALTSAQIPDSIRALFSYVGGLPKGTNASYGELFELVPYPKGLHGRSADNDVVTSKISPRDLSAFYEHALRGDYFTKPKTLSDFLITMSCGSDLAENALPHGSSAYMKGGSIAGVDEAIAVGGAMITLDKTLYFTIGVNWPGAKTPYSEVETLFFSVHKQILSLARSAQFS